MPFLFGLCAKRIPKMPENEFQKVLDAIYIQYYNLLTSKITASQDDQDFCQYKGYHYKVDCLPNQDQYGEFMLHIKIQNSWSKTAERIDDCVICNTITENGFSCCENNICKKCIHKMQEEDKFICPMCRTNMSNSTTVYTFGEDHIDLLKI